MRRPASFLIALLVATGARAEPAPPPAIDASSPPTPPLRRAKPIVVLDLVPVGATREIAVNLTAVIASEVARYNDLRPITRGELVTMVDVERQRALAGCSDDNCVADVAGLLGAPKVLGGQIGQLENEHVLTLFVIDTRTGRVEARVQHTAKVGSGRLLEVTKSAVTDLIGSQSSSRNQPPRVAVPSRITAHRGDRVVLDASRCYDPDGDPLQVHWRQLDGPPALLEDAQTPTARFVAAEVGESTFAVDVGDGRSPPQEQTVKVEVRELRRFSIGIAFQALIAFNRFVDGKDGRVFQNRTPLGAAVPIAFRLSERWRLVGELGAATMHVYPEGVGDSPTVDSVDVTSVHVLVGARYRFPFDGFDFFLSTGVGTERLYLSARQSFPEGRLEYQGIRSEGVFADGMAGVDVPLGERFGLLILGGIRARAATDRVSELQGMTFQIARNAFLWGVNGTAGLYVNL